jgi:hypothetical protein
VQTRGSCVRLPVSLLTLAAGLGVAWGQAFTLIPKGGPGSGFLGVVQGDLLTVGGISYLRATASLLSCHYFYAGITGEPEDGLLLAVAAFRGDCVPEEPWGAELLSAGSNTVPLGVFPPGTYPLELWGVWSENPVTLVVPEQKEFPLRLTPTETSVRIEVVGLPNVLYAIQHSTNLVNWQELTSGRGPFTHTQSLTAAGQRSFYRLVARE